MKSLASLACLVALPLVAALGCGSGDTSDAPGGKGGAGGAFSCPMGSTETSPGQCDSTLAAWDAGPALLQRRDHHATFARKNADGSKFLYVLGGMVDMASLLDEAERAPIHDDGTLGDWEVMPRLPRKMAGHTLATMGDTVLLMGGFGSSETSRYTDIVTIGSDGSIGDWASGPLMNTGRAHSMAVVHAHGKDSYDVFVSGGLVAPGNDNTPSVEKATFSGGALSEWAETTPFPEKRSHHAVIGTEKGIYSLGGIQGDPAGVNTTLSEVLYSAYDANGDLGEWEHIGDLPTPLCVFSGIEFVGYLYIYGGLTDTKFVSDVRRAKIADDGTLGEWESVPSLPSPKGHVHQNPLFEGHVYNVGGFYNKSLDKVFVGTFE